MTLPIGFTDPAWLLVAVPIAVAIGLGWLAASRRLPAGRRAASLVIRILLAASLVLDYGIPT